MTRSRMSVVVPVVTLVLIAAGLGTALPGAARRDEEQPFPGSYDRRGAVDAAANVFVGQVVGERLFCPATSGVGPVMVDDYFDVEVERNVKGRVEGTVVVWQTTDDTVQFGPDGRMETGRKYLLITRPNAGRGIHVMVDHTLGYALIDGPEERAELVAEVREYLDDPYTPTSTAGPRQQATWDAQSTRAVATFMTYPTPSPCGPEVIATATAAGELLARDNRALVVAGGTPVGAFPPAETPTP